MTRGRLTSLLLLAATISSSLPAAATSAAEVLARAKQTYAEQGPRAALPEYEEALRLFRAAQDRSGEAITLGYIGNCHKRFGDFEQARELLETALRMKRDLGDAAEEAKTLNHLGLLDWEIADYPAALARFERSLEIARAAGDRRTEGAALNNTSLVYDELGEYERSLTQYQMVLETYEGLDFPRGVSDTLGNIGGVHLMLGRYRTALDHYRRSLAITEREGLRPSVAQDLLNISLCHLGLGEIDDAFEAASRALDLAREAGLELEEAYALRARAGAALHRGDYDPAIADLEAALAIYDAAGARGDQLEALGEAGEALLGLGDIGSAERHFSRAAALARETGDASGGTAALIDLGLLELRRRRHEVAAALFQEAANRAREAGEQALLATSRIQLAVAHRESGALETAAKAADDALATSREIGAALLESRALWAAGEVALLRSGAGEALNRFVAGLPAAEAVGDPDLLWRLDYGRARALIELDRRDEAVAALERAVERIEGVRSRLRKERFRAGYIEDKYQVYVDLVRLLLELGRTEEAFVTAERLRARSFLGLLNRGLPPSADASERRREVELRERVRRLQDALADETGGSAEWRREPAVELYSRELEGAEREYQEFLDDHMASSAYATLRALEIPSVRRLQQRLPARSAVLEYVVAEDAVVIFVLTRDRLVATTVDVESGELSGKVELLRDLLQRPENDFWRRPAAALGEILVSPVERSGRLAEVERIFLVPHGILHYIPFGVLVRDVAERPRLLIEDFTISSVPSAAAAGRDRPAPSRELLAMAPARTRLRWAPSEVRTIGSMYPAGSRSVLIGGRATEGAFKAEAGGHRLLHLASHGHFNRFNPLLSGIELESGAPDDGRLEVHEILRLDLGAELVTLSACDTALGTGYFSQFPPGDEFVSLTRAFLFAGADSVLATLWKVDDRSTLDLMAAFYRRLESADETAPEALAVAQRGLASGRRYAHPFFWAPFVLLENLE